MKKLFFTLFIIINVFQSAHAMDQELMVYEGIRAGLFVGAGAVIGFGLSKIIPSEFWYDNSGKFCLSQYAAIPVCLAGTVINDSTSFLGALSPALYGIGGSFFVLKKYEAYLDRIFPNRLELGDTPLIFSIQRSNGQRSSQNLQKIKFLIENQADVNMCNDRGYSPLAYAIEPENPDLKLINLLLENNADLAADTRAGSLFDRVLDEKPIAVKKIVIAHALKLARGNDFSIFYRMCRDQNNEIVFFGALDEHNKTVFDYAIDHKNRRAVVKFLNLIRNTEKFSFKGLRSACMFCFAENVNTIDLENPENIAKLRDVFHLLTAHYKTQNPEIMD